MPNDLKGKFYPLCKHNVDNSLVDLPARQPIADLRDEPATFLGVSEQITECVPCAETLREVLLVADSSLRSALRATFVSRTFCVGAYSVGPEGRTLRDLEVEDLNSTDSFVAG